MIYSSTGVSKRGNEAQTFLYGFTEGLLTIDILFGKAFVLGSPKTTVPKKISKRFPR